MKQIYKITYPTGKIYIGKDSIGSYRYYGSPDMHVVNEDFAKLTESVRRDYTIRKQILWESEDCSEAELSAKEVEFIREFRSNNPEIGYNRWPKFNGDTNRLMAAGCLCHGSFVAIPRSSLCFCVNVRAWHRADFQI